MAGNIKFHAIAIALISLIVVVLYATIGQKQATGTATQAHSNYTIKIVTATWGENCNPYMADAITQQQNAATDANDALQQPLKPVTTDNVLKQVATVCDGKPACELSATIDTFHLDPLPGCFKNLVVGYRCFNYDLLTTKNIGQGELLKIDCNSQAPAANAPAKP